MSNPKASPSPYSIVIDAETLNNTPDAVVLEIGAIAFVRQDFQKLDEFECRPSVADQLALGRSYSTDTIRWHQAKGTLGGYALDETPLARAMRALDLWIESIAPHTVWIQGTCFDRPLIESVCRDLGKELPWFFTKSRDARTLFALAFGDEKHPPRPHRAKADAAATLDSIAKAWLQLRDHGPVTV